MENKERLKELKEKKESLVFILEANFETIEEYNAFKEENIDSFIELKQVNQEIRNLEWQLMSPKEQQELLEYYKKIKEKYSNE
ncbi:hypothetical protein [uncultured Psychroserpens sp.]|uniref:hypothetical protein n=1 Tax=uncultured Psychroserpens sp. TaxID=255436 RepID=UPI00261D4686|nr:hypothetical protein [uncultured Psychroserpens sp.]